jgi:hypothetical protein
LKYFLLTSTKDFSPLWVKNGSKQHPEITSALPLENGHQIPETGFCVFFTSANRRKTDIIGWPPKSQLLAKLGHSSTHRVYPRKIGFWLEVTRLFSIICRV